MNTNIAKDMKFYTTMHEGLKPYYEKELEQYRIALRKNNYTKAWKHLEYAHILGQSYPKEHTAVHWLMLKFGLRIKNFREILGQIPRLIFGGVKSFVGVIPVGNTGGSNVSALKPMEIPKQLKQILEKFRHGK